MEFSDVIAELREEYSHLRFILITSPSPRCGVTLIQRMINAGGQCVIYGENNFLMFKLPTTMLSFLDPYKLEATRKTADRFFGGHRNIDATALYPDYVRYVRENIRFFYRLVEFYQEESQMRGANCWGMKIPLASPRWASALLKLLSLPQMIITSRDLGAVARSMYARWPHKLKNPEAFRTFGYSWAENKKFLDAIQGDQVLHINYEEWMKNPDIVANSIEKTFGVRVAREEMERKINIHDFDPNIKVAQRQKGGWYLLPQNLPPEADEWLQQGVQRFLEKG
jgi:Sulfotransferase family